MASTTKTVKTIGEAITAAMAGVRKLAKTSENTFDHYRYASIDDFLAMIGPLMAEHGLFYSCNELSVEIMSRANKPWLRFRFEFVLRHASGESMPPEQRTVFVPFNGAQASGSAQSYALKQWLRAQFAIPTGDNDDPDAQPTNTDPVDVEYISLDEVETIQNMIKEGGWDIKSTCRRLGVSDLVYLEKHRVPEVIERLAIALEAHKQDKGGEQ